MPADKDGPPVRLRGRERGKYGLDWMPQLRRPVRPGLDGISLWLFALTSLLMITAVFSSWESVTERAPTHYALLLALQTGLLGLFASLDVVLFYIFFEFTLIPLFFLIGLFGGPGAAAGVGDVLPLHAGGSLLTLLGVIALVAVHYQHTSPHVLTFSIPELTEGLANLGGASGRTGRPGATGATGPNSRASRSGLTPQVAIFMLLFRRVRDQGARCSRSTPGCRWPTSRRRRPGRSCWPA